MKIKTLGMAALLLVGASGAQAQSFDVSDIRVEGLQRVSAASVFNAFPVSANDRVSEQQLAAAARDLFATGLFEDVSLMYRPGLPPALTGCSFEIPGGTKVKKMKN